MDETIFVRQINSDPVEAPRGLVPSRIVLKGSAIRFEPLDPIRHGKALFRAGHAMEAARQSWEYLPWGPFATEEALHDQLRKFAAASDLVYYAVCDPVTGEAVGKATYLDIQPSSGVIEIGGIWFAPAFQRTRAATEALFLLLTHAIDDLGYRRMQWRCNAAKYQESGSRDAALFRFEGIWFNHMITKGLNRDTAWYSILDTEWPEIRTAIEVWLEPTNFDANGSQRQSLAVMTAALR